MRICFGRSVEPIYFIGSDSSQVSMTFWITVSDSHWMKQRDNAEFWEWLAMDTYWYTICMRLDGSIAPVTFDVSTEPY